MILSTHSGAVHEMDVCANDATTAVVLADETVREGQPEEIVTNVHARRVAQ